MSPAPGCLPSGPLSWEPWADSGARPHAPPPDAVAAGVRAGAPAGRALGGVQQGREDPRGVPDPPREVGGLLNSGRGRGPHPPPRMEPVVRAGRPAPKSELWKAGCGRGPRRPQPGVSLLGGEGDRRGRRQGLIRTQSSQPAHRRRPGPTWRRPASWTCPARSARTAAGRAP